ncbi:MAG: hypothetical protein NTW48_10130 [Chloroflexi bacterium]|nr:hypothetical protein [Chloroflexota bacterium]
MATMLSVAQAVANELGLPPINSVIGNTNLDVIQILALMNAAGTELCMEHNWRALDKEFRFTTKWHQSVCSTVTGSAVVTGIDTTVSLAANTYMATGASIPQDTYIVTVDSPTQVTLSQAATATSSTDTITFGQQKYSLPSDYDRMVDRTQWDKSKHWEMLGPESPQQWQWLKSGYIATGPRLRWRMLGDTFQIWPIISTSEYLGFEYISNGWATSALGVSQSSFTADTDTFIFVPRLLILFTKKKYFEIKGFNSAQITTDLVRYMNIAKAEDAGAAPLSFAAKPSQVLVGWAHLPDSGYGT